MLPAITEFSFVDGTTLNFSRAKYENDFNVKNTFKDLIGVRWCYG